MGRHDPAARARPGPARRRSAEQAAAAAATSDTDAWPPGERLRPLLRLQSQAGNQAVARLLTTAGPGPARARERAVQRFVGHEHESIGNVTGADVDLGGGVVLTWGEVVAIAGDEFGSIDELQTAATTEDGRRRIRAALEHDEVRGPIPASLPAITNDDRKAQSTQYLLLALKNVTHFAEGGDALATWRSHHSQALYGAMNAGLLGDEVSFQSAQATEAFGQHFLTDMFSGGHVRVPRAQIMAFYADRATAMAQAFVASLRARVEDGLVSQVMLQIGPALRGNYAYRKAKEKVHAAVGAKLDEALAGIGGMPVLATYFGLAIAGAISGALHDREGRNGVVVSSAAHPQPWLAMGDARLAASPVSRDQAEMAVLGAREEVLAARETGAREEKLARIAPTSPPAIVHFAFNSAAIEPGAGAAVEAAGAYMHVNPADYVELIGHTDPVGSEDYNQALGQRRADAVKAGVLAAGGRVGQAEATSQGESHLLVSDPKRYGENRRVEFIWQSGTAAPEPDTGQSADPRRERAEEAIAAMGPPFSGVEQFIPHPVEAMNEPLPEWRWGSMAPEIITGLDTWVKDMVGPHIQELLGNVPETMTEEGYTFAPRQIVEGIAAEFMGAPAQTLGKLIGEPPG